MASLAQGRVFTGRQAVDMGLADTLGGMQTAITLASDMAKLANAPVEFIERDASGFSMMLMRLVRRAMAQSGMTDVLKSVLRNDYVGAQRWQLHLKLKPIADFGGRRLGLC